MRYKNGFTLIELLVVVLIIGILAAIALPQYRLAVGKAKFSTLKNLTKSIAEARNRYFLVHSAYPESINDLDIDIDVVSSLKNPGLWFKFTTSQDITCMVWTFDTNMSAACNKTILGKQVHFYISPNGYSPKYCLVYSLDTNDLANKLCQKETGRSNGNCANSEGYCSYSY